MSLVLWGTSKLQVEIYQKGNQGSLDCRKTRKTLSSGSVRSYKDHRSNKTRIFDPLKEQEIETAKQYIIQAKQFAKQKDPSNINLAIMMYQKAKKILPNNEKLTIRIAALENRLAKYNQKQKMMKRLKKPNRERKLWRKTLEHQARKWEPSLQ